MLSLTRPRSGGAFFYVVLATRRGKADLRATRFSFHRDMRERLAKVLPNRPRALPVHLDRATKFLPRVIVRRRFVVFSQPEFEGKIR